MKDEAKNPVVDSDQFVVSIDVFTMYFIDAHTNKLTSLTPDEQDAVIRFHFDKLRDRVIENGVYIGMLKEDG